MGGMMGGMMGGGMRGGWAAEAGTEPVADMLHRLDPVLALTPAATRGFFRCVGHFLANWPGFAKLFSLHHSP